MTNYLIPYKRLKGHEDPLLREYTYGHDKNRGKMLYERVKEGDYLFFHTHRKGKDVLTAYYVVEQVLPTEEAQKDDLITRKFKNPHLSHEPFKWDTLVFGNPIYSKVLEHPVDIDKETLAGLSSNPKSIVRPWVKLNNDDIRLLLQLIETREKQGFLKETFLSSSEVEQLQELDIESFIHNNATKLGEYKAFKRQYELKSGNRIDLILKGSHGLLIVEVKKGAIGPEALNQLKGYIQELKDDRELKGEVKLGVKGVIVCADILPYFEDYYRKQIENRRVEVYTYGWRFNLNKYVTKSSLY